MRIAVTGASGNVGTALLRLLYDSDDDIVAISRRRPPREAPYDRADWHPVDIGEPAAGTELQQAFAGVDAVIHLAWLIQPTRRPEIMHRVNRTGTAAVRDAAIAAGVPHFVHMSSVGAYSPGPGTWVDETWPTDGVPTSSYSADKAATERLMDEVGERMLVTRVRPALIFQDEAASEVVRYFLGRLVPRVLIRRGVLRLAPLPDELAFQVVHADDAATALELVVRLRVDGAINVAAGPLIDRTAWREVFGGVGPALPPRVLRAIADATFRARLQQTEPGWIDMAVAVPHMCTTRLKSLGWSPRRDARDVLGSFIDAMGRRAGRPGPVLYSH